MPTDLAVLIVAPACAAAWWTADTAPAASGAKPPPVTTGSGLRDLDLARWKRARPVWTRPAIAVPATWSARTPAPGGRRCAGTGRSGAPRRLMGQSPAAMRDDFEITVPHRRPGGIIKARLGTEGGVRMTGGGSAAAWSPACTREGGRG